ncbi:MAG: chitobiase/beta-hexosaminidase C-terminal domain-containing protein [Planctomycetes bacterium]|nr:chitobiase/beta-hexosaminidase C-terminal domain-containing protein [Planctomycetota bacterium]
MSIAPPIALAQQRTTAARSRRRAALFAMLIALLMAGSPAAHAASFDVSPTSPAIIPFSSVIGGSDAGNNAKNNANGGYFSEFDNIGQFNYPAGHGNQLGNTAMVNDSTNYFDNVTWQGGQPAGLSLTGVPAPDPGCGDAAWWPATGDWVSYQLNVTTAGTYTVLTRFSTAWGPTGTVTYHMTIDGVSSGPVTMRPDDIAYWTPGAGGFQRPIDGWWGHNYVPGTMPTGWSLAVGPHVLKVFIDSWPGSAPGPSSSGPGDIWLHYFKVFAGGTPVSGPVPAPTFSFSPSLASTANGPMATGPVTVTIADGDPTAVIHVTTDGSTPTASSPTYTAPFTISALGAATIKALAIDGTDSPVATTTFTIASPPTVATAASAAPNPVTGTTTVLSALGASTGAGGEPTLTYTWSTTGSTPAAVRFSANGSNAAKSVTATFTGAGTYTFQVAIADPFGLAVTSSVSVVVDRTVTGVAVVPRTAWISAGSSFTFTAAAVDQFGAAISGTPTVTWSATGGTISAGGVYTAGNAAGTFSVTAASSTGSGSAIVVVTAGFAVSITFQPAQTPPFGNFLVDNGALFGDRGNGLSYGWDQDLSTWARERQGKGGTAPDAGHDRLIYLQRAGNAVFRITVPNGTYSVHIISGDATYSGSVFKMSAQGVLVVDGTPTPANRWIEGTQTVTVTDGTLAVTSATGAQNNKICQLDIAVVPAAVN